MKGYKSLNGFLEGKNGNSFYIFIHKITWFYIKVLSFNFFDKKKFKKNSTSHFFAHFRKIMVLFLF